MATITDSLLLGLWLRASCMNSGTPSQWSNTEVQIVQLYSLTCKIVTKIVFTKVFIGQLKFIGKDTCHYVSTRAFYAFVPLYV